MSHYLRRNAELLEHVLSTMGEPRDGESFRPLFDALTADLQPYMTVRARQLGLSSGAHPVPRLTSWEEGGPIELCFVDCGRTMETNDAWYSVLSPYFIPDRTLLVLQDWHTYMDMPQQWYNQIKMFTDSKGATLDLVYEVVDGGVATFVYRALYAADVPDDRWSARGQCHPSPSELLAHAGGRPA